MRPFPLLLLFLLCSAIAHAEPKDAVVAVKSHGASATVIWTTRGRTLLLGCAHAYEGANRHKRHEVLAPDPRPGMGWTDTGGMIRLLRIDYRADLSLVEVPAGPFPWVAPVASPGHRPGRLLSVGYDEMRLPPQVRTATLLGSAGNRAYTREQPWHGRSGGALLDQDLGQLVGVVHGYECDPARFPGDRPRFVPGRHRGLYVSHAAILTFLRDPGTAVPAPSRPLLTLPGSRPG